MFLPIQLVRSYETALFQHDVFFKMQSFPMLKQIKIKKWQATKILSSFYTKREFFNTGSN